MYGRGRLIDEEVDKCTAEVCIRPGAVFIIYATGCRLEYLLLQECAAHSNSVADMRPTQGSDFRLASPSAQPTDR